MSSHIGKENVFLQVWSGLVCNNGLNEAVAIKAFPVNLLRWDPTNIFLSETPAFHSALLVKEYGGLIISLYPL